MLKIKLAWHHDNDDDDDDIALISLNSANRHTLVDPEACNALKKEIFPFALSKQLLILVSQSVASLSCTSKDIIQ